MKVISFIQKSLCIVLSISTLLAFSACTKTEDIFTETKNGNIVSNTGTEYTHFAHEGQLYYLGELVFEGSVEGEPKTSEHLCVSYQTGMFSLKHAKNNNVLIRYCPNDEWAHIYRKASLPRFDFTVDNCSRLELVIEIEPFENSAVHATCGDGISKKSKIKKFLFDIRSQKSPKEAGLYDLIRKPDGMLENCYRYAVIYGFFEEEPNLVVRMEVFSLNDLAYYVRIEDKEYILPEKWIKKLQK